MLLQVTLDLAQQAQESDLSGSSVGFGGFVTTILGGVMVVAALLVLIYLIWGGVEWITAGGESGKIQKARDKITQSVIGIIVLASMWALFLVIQNFLGINVLSGTNGSRSGGANGNAGGNSGTNTATTCAGGVAIGRVVEDGGAGGYCSNGGSARVKCVAAGQGPAGLPYPHFEPCSCASGTTKVSGYTFSSC